MAISAIELLPTNPSRPAVFTGVGTLPDYSTGSVPSVEFCKYSLSLKMGGSGKHFRNIPSRLQSGFLIPLFRLAFIRVRLPGPE